MFASRYQIIEELGSGGMGKVYRAHDRNAEIYSLLGMKDEAIAGLKAEIRPDVHPAYLAHPYLYNLLVFNNPHFDGIRNDPRFADILAAEKKLYEECKRKYGGTGRFCRAFARDPGPSSSGCLRRLNR